MASRQRRAVRSLGGLLLVAALGLAASATARGMADYRILEDDRPAIRVKGGSIIFEIDPRGRPARAMWRKDRTRNEWKPVQQDATSAAFYTVTTDPAGVCGPPEMSSTEVEVGFGEEGALRKFRFKIRERQPFGPWEPKLEPLDTPALVIREDGKLLVGDLPGTLRTVQAKGHDACNLRAGTEVIIQPRRKH